MLQRCQLASAPRLAASNQRRSPNVLGTASPRMVATAPTGSVKGILDQSFAYTSANSMKSNFARSVVLASMSPKFVLLSSKDHQRVFGIPEKDTGVGMSV